MIHDSCTELRRALGPGEVLELHGLGFRCIPGSWGEIFFSQKHAGNVEGVGQENVPHSWGLCLRRCGPGPPQRGSPLHPSTSVHIGVLVSPSPPASSWDQSPLPLPLTGDKQKLSAGHPVQCPKARPQTRNGSTPDHDQETNGALQPRAEMEFTDGA